MIKKREISSAPQRHPLLLVRLHQEAQLRRRYVAQLPWWRHPIIGYLSSVLLTALCLLISFMEHMLTGNNSFLGTPFFLVTIVVALFWGAGPALCSILLAALAIDYYFLPPTGQFDAKNWTDIAPLVPYMIAAISIALITAQRERARQRALFAEQEAQEYAKELEEINAQLRQANQLKDIFFSSASHELKTPLTTIQGQAQIGLRRLAKISAPPPQLEPVQNSLQKIDEQTHRLHGLVDDLLDLGMLSAGKMKLRRNRCNLGDICREIVNDQRLLSGRTIELDLPEPDVVLQADRERLNQVLQNLVTNAIKYSTEGSTVSVRVLLQPSTVQIQVHNQGPVIPPEQRESIFEPFYRAPNSHTARKEGWGLGLAISRDIIERHNGHIWVESSASSGTTFFVELPLS